MTLYRSLPLLCLCLWAQEPARPPSASTVKGHATTAPEQGRSRPLRLRAIVEDEEGKRVPEARIFFASRNLSELDPREAPSQLEVRADERGRAIIPLDAAQDWTAWAVAGAGKARMASEVQTGILERGILRLTVKPFPVPFLRISNLAPWRKLYPGKLSLLYVSYAAPYARFPQSLPEGDDEIRELPPLPNDSYFPVLWHSERGFLDTVYLSPAFHEGQADAEVLYERDYPLKKCIFGSPLLIRGKVTGMGGKPSVGARLRSGPENKIPCPLRQTVVTDQEGRYELVIPFKPESRRTYFDCDVVVWAPESQLVQYSLAGFRKRFEQSVQREGDKASTVYQRDFSLTPGMALDWRGSGFVEGDRLFLRTQPLSGGNPGIALGTRIRRDGAGRLLLPGRRTLGAKVLVLRNKSSQRSPSIFEVYLQRGSTVFALAGQENRALPQRLALDLGDMGTLEAQVSSTSGRPLKRGYCQVKRHFSNGLAQVATCLGLSGRGVIRQRLPVGRYVLRISHKPLGEAYASFEIAKGKTTKVQVKVEPYVRIRGKISCEDEEVKIAGLPIQLYPQQIRKDKVSAVARVWAQQSLQQITLTSGQDGNFELLLSPFVERVSVQTYAAVANRYLSAQVMVNPASAKEIVLPLR